MYIPALIRFLTFCTMVLVYSSIFFEGQGLSDQAAHNRETLQYGVFLCRYGVRSPTKEPSQFYTYSAAPRPQWSVPPGYLTAHGLSLIRLIGVYDRAYLAAKGLLSPTGYKDTSAIAILADSESQQPRDIESTGIPQHSSRILTSLAQQSVFRRRDTSKEAKCDQAAIFQSSF